LQNQKLHSIVETAHDKLMQGEKSFRKVEK
jgi:hypothetical protein